MKYANSTHALRALLELSEREEESKRGRITKFSAMIYTQPVGLNYYFVEATDSSRCRYLIQAHWEKNDELVARTAEKSKVSFRGFG